MATSCSETVMTMCHIISPDDVVTRGARGIGVVLRLMDICACGSAELLAKQSCVTLSMDDLIFNEEETAKLQAGQVLNVISQVNRAFNTSMEVGVACYMEDPGNPEQKDVDICRSYFTFVALDKNGSKSPIPRLVALTDINRRRMFMAQERRKLRFKRKDILSEAQADSDKCSALDDSSKSVEVPSSSSRVVMTEIVLPPHANHMGNTFGGQVMSWMDKAALISASRFLKGINRKGILQVTGVDDVFFYGPSTVGDRIEITAFVSRSFGVTLDIACSAQAYGLDGVRRKINQAYWQIHAFHCNIELPRCKPIKEDEIAEYQTAIGRRNLRIQRKSLEDSSHSGKLEISWRWQQSLASDLCAKNVDSLMAAFWGTVEWEPLRVEGSSSLFHKTEQGVTCLKLTTRLNAPAEKAFRLTLDIKRRPEWDCVFKEANILVKGENNDIGAWVFAESADSVRDFSLLRSWRVIDNNLYVIASRSVLHPGVPESSKFQRAEVLSSGFIIENIDTPTGQKPQQQCDFTYILQLGRTATSLSVSTLTGRSKALVGNITRLAAILQNDSNEKTVVI